MPISVNQSVGEISLTATTFKALTTRASIPADMMILQNVSPSSSWLVAFVLRSPNAPIPSISIANASVTNPESSPRDGQ